MSRLSLVALLALAPAFSAFGSVPRPVHHPVVHRVHRYEVRHHHAHLRTAALHRHHEVRRYRSAHLEAAALHAHRREHAVRVETVALHPAEAVAPHPVEAAALHPAAQVQSAAMVTAPLDWRRFYFFSPLRGTLASLERQNSRNAAEGLERIQNDAQLEAMVADKELLPIPVNAGMRASDDLPVNRRYARPWTVHFLADLARAYAARFGEALVVTSAVRPVNYQRHLLRINGNAAALSGDTASPHMTGAAVDIGKKGMSMSEKAWMRAYLLPLQNAGKIDVEEEFMQACFHINVYTNYSPQAAPAWPRRHSSATLLAAQMR